MKPRRAGNVHSRWHGSLSGANIGRAKARAAIRLAEGLGLIAIEETPDRKRVIVNRGIKSRC
jgi:hypothetical protein